jgi:hypothetical protein
VGEEHADANSAATSAKRRMLGIYRTSGARAFAPAWIAGDPQGACGRAVGGSILEGVPKTRGMLVI